jgi:hypothetical protein
MIRIPKEFFILIKEETGKYHLTIKVSVDEYLEYTNLLRKIRSKVVKFWKIHNTKNMGLCHAIADKVLKKLNNDKISEKEAKTEITAVLKENKALD